MDLAVQHNTNNFNNIKRKFVIFNDGNFEDLDEKFTTLILAGEKLPKDIILETDQWYININDQLIINKDNKKIINYFIINIKNDDISTKDSDNKEFNNNDEIIIKDKNYNEENHNDENNELMFNIDNITTISSISEKTNDEVAQINRISRSNSPYSISSDSSNDSNASNNSKKSTLSIDMLRCDQQFFPGNLSPQCLHRGGPLSQSKSRSQIDLPFLPTDGNLKVRSL